MKKCEIKECETRHYAFGYCRKHYVRFKRNGTTVPKYDLSLYSKLGGVKDKGKGRRGSLAVNIVNDLKFKAKQRKKEWALTHQEAFDLITSKCSYCGFAPNWPKNRVGIDRVNNDLGYKLKNCVSACFTCNSAKGVLGHKEFRSWVKRIHDHLLSNKHKTTKCSHPDKTDFGVEIWCQLCRAKAFG